MTTESIYKEDEPLELTLFRLCIVTPLLPFTLPATVLGEEIVVLALKCNDILPTKLSIRVIMLSSCCLYPIEVLDVFGYKQELMNARYPPRVLNRNKGIVFFCGRSEVVDATPQGVVLLAEVRQHTPRNL